MQTNKLTCLSGNILRYTHTRVKHYFKENGIFVFIETTLQTLQTFKHCKHLNIANIANSNTFQTCVPGSRYPDLLALSAVTVIMIFPVLHLVVQACVTLTSTQTHNHQYEYNAFDVIVSTTKLNTPDGALSHGVSQIVFQSSFCIERVQYLPFPTYRCLLTTLQQKTFENIVAKGEIAHNILGNNTFIYRYFLCFCLDIFKVVCCRFVVCGKGLFVRI